MILRLPWIATVFVAALMFGQGTGVSTFPHEGNDSSAQLAHSALSSEAQNPKRQSAARANRRFNIDAAELMRDFESGERRQESIQAELLAVAGDNPPLRWGQQVLKQPYKLTQILSHTQNLENNFELLMIHTFPDQNQKEDVITHYTGRVLEADEKTIGASIVFSRLLESKNGRLRFDDKSRSQYFFSLKPKILHSNFSLRAPEGTYQIGPVREGSFDPLAILTTESGTFDEVGEYQYEIEAGGTQYIVNVIPRITDIETLTIEVGIREVNSLVTNTFVLVYEEI